MSKSYDEFKKSIVVFSEKFDILVKTLDASPYILVYDFNETNNQWILRPTSIILNNIPDGVKLSPNGTILSIKINKIVYVYLWNNNKWILH